MTLHIHYNHQCSECQAYYIPYSPHLPCPRCGIVEEECFDFIAQAAESAHYNLMSQGSYMPMAWYVGSLGDHVLFLLFRILERYRTNAEGKIFSELVQEVVDQMDFGDQEYLRDHLRDLAVKVYERLERTPPPPQ